MRVRNWLSRGLAMILLLAGSVAQAQTLLRYKFKEGEKLEYTSENKMKMTTDFGGIKIAINLNQSMEMTWKIGKINSDGSAQVAMKLERMIMDIDAPPPIGGVRIDSKDDKESDNVLAQQFSKLIKKLAGQEIKATMTPLGEFKDVKYPAELEKELKELGAGIGLGGASGIEQFTGGGVILPKDAVKKDDKWTHKTEATIPKVGTAKVEMKYTYEGEDGSLEKIGVRPRMIIEGEKAGLTLKADEKKSKGTVLFNNQDGKISEIQMTQFMTITVEMMGLTIPMSMEMTSLLKLKGGTK